MHKNTYVTYTTMSAIAVSAILLTSYTAGSMLFSQRAIAQTNATSAAPSAAPNNATSAAPSNATAPVGQSFVWQGTKSSVADPLAKHGKEQIAWILLPRADDAVYSGVLTYTASKGANPEVWHLFSPGNSTAFSKTFGVVSAAPYHGKSFAVADISSSGASGSVPFSGNAIVLHGKSPFTVTYTVNAVAQPAKTFNNIQSMVSATPPATPTKTKTSSNSTSGTSSKSSK